MIKWIISVLIILLAAATCAQAQLAPSPEATMDAKPEMIASNATGSSIPEAKPPETVGIDPAGFPKVKVSAFIDSFCALDGGLSREDFRLRENGTDVAVDGFCFSGNASGQKLDLAIVFDDTDSMAGKIRDLQLKVKDLTEKINSSRLDARYCLVTFKGEANVRTNWTTDAESFKREVGKLYGSGGNNRMPEYALGGIEEALSFGFRQDAQKVLMIVTDEPSHQKGDGSSNSTFSMEDVRRDILGSGAMLIAVSPNFSDPKVDPNVPSQDLPRYADMRELAEETGGIWIDLNSDDFSAILEWLKGLLTGAYVLEYTSPDPSPGEVRDVSVHVNVPGCAEVNASSFYTTPGSPTSPEEKNEMPEIISLSSDKTSPQESGALIIWEANATDPDGDEVLYRFLLDGKPVASWTKEGRWLWNSSEADLGPHIIEVQARDGKHGQDEPDDFIKAEFNITKPESKASAAKASSWNRIFGGQEEDRGYFASQTSDEGYILTGYITSYGAGDVDLWLIKAYSNGSKVWDRTFGGPGRDRGESVQQTNDGGYIIAGHTNTTGAGGRDVWLIKTDSNGSMLWNRTFGGPDEDWGYCVQETRDGGYIVAGDTYSFGAGDRDVWLIKTNSNGSKEWDRTFGWPGYDGGISAQQTTDGGYIIAGRTNSSGRGDDVWLIKTDSNGDRLWDEIFGGPNDDWGYCVQETSDGGYIVAGDTESYGSGGKDVWLIKTDSSGNKEWDKTFGGPSWDWGVSVLETDAGEYLAAGSTYSYGAGNVDLLLIKVDRDGDEIWERTLGGPDEDWGCSVEQTVDGGYVVAGSTRSYSARGLDAWLIKADGNGSLSQ